ncbi:MAG: Acyl-CoA synthetases (AMP-forming)/AMP-acid ligases II [Xanthobacteraceae bacterium]|nr:MAG: Acyl-CoA synthetases (AMP-forming)/AMP-acid ligases II [Xanthobacteraceae bacterium]
MANHLFDLVRLYGTEPAKTFIETEDGTVFTYDDLFAATGRFAHALVASGVKPGDRVAVQVEKSPGAIFLYLACVRAGAVFLPLNTGYTLAEIEYFLSDAEPSLVVCDPGRREGIAEVAARTGVPAVETLGRGKDGSLWNKANAQEPVFDTVSRDADDLAAILYTSGTTGRSKGAMLTHDNLASNALTLKDYWKFTKDDVLLHALPIFHTHGLFVATNTILMAGASMLFLPKFDTPGATRHMRLFISGSAPLLAETHRAFREKTGQAILERYGMTETNMNTSNPYDGERVAGTVGFPLPGVELRVTDPETGAAIPQGEIGMIEVKGPNVFKGYWRMPEKTAAEFRADGFFITGDLGKIDPDGYVHIVGRGKDLVISGGYNVYPKEVETEIDGMAGVFESAVIGVPHPDFGEGVTAVVVPTPGAKLDEGTILTALEARLAKFKLPKRVIVVDDLPRNTMGKVQKNVLRETYKGIYGA